VAAARFFENPIARSVDNSKLCENLQRKHNQYFTEMQLAIEMVAAAAQ
jgi:hypothetical protein